MTHISSFILLTHSKIYWSLNLISTWIWFTEKKDLLMQSGVKSNNAWMSWFSEF